jgi:hypothetical protein
MDNLQNFLPTYLTISAKSFDDLLAIHSSKTVGKILKRFEISDSKDVIKAQVKELLYESYRDLKDLIIALNYGYHISSMEFKSPVKNGV